MILFIKFLIAGCIAALIQLSIQFTYRNILHYYFSHLPLKSIPLMITFALYFNNTLLVYLIICYTHNAPLLIIISFYCCLLSVIFIIDLQYCLIPDMLSLSLLWLGLYINRDLAFTSAQSAILGAIVGYVCFALFSSLFFIIKGQEGLGRGDSKLLAAAGAWLGVSQLPVIVFIGSSLTLLMVVIKHLQGDFIPRHLPFGPGLATGMNRVIFYHLLQSYGLLT